MARKPRHNAPGHVHHVMARSIKELSLFEDNQDRRVFTGLLRARLKKTKYRLLNASLQHKHYHLTILASERPLADLLRPVNSQYAKYYNKKYDRRGTLFDGRPKSIVVQTSQYITKLICYVCLNSLRHRELHSMAELDRYRWCGHAALMGYPCEFDFMDTELVLKWFGDTVEQARANYLTVLQKDLHERPQTHVLELIRRANREVSHYDDPSCTVIGDEQFTREVVRQDHENQMRLSELKRRGWSLDTLAGHVGQRMDVDSGQLRRRCGRGALGRARQAFAYTGYRMMGVSQVKIGKYLGITAAAVSSLVAKGEAVAQAHRVTDIPVQG
ncbi:MAG: hypothetical protein GF331_25240 [Chitinivibrionales bacterium]|nr:hypothetical protein [Chitinivibrionales bacterium]